MEHDSVGKLLKSTSLFSDEQSIDGLTQSNEYLKALIEFVTSVIHINSVEEVVWLLTDRIIGKLGFEDCVVYLVDESTNQLNQVAAYGPKNPVEHQVLDPITLKFGEGVVGACASLKQPILINDTRLEENYIVDDAPRLSELAVPIIYEQKVIGVIDSEHSSSHFYTPHHKNTLEAIASVISTKYANVAAISKLEQTIEKLEEFKTLQQAVFDIAELVYLSSSLDDFYARLHRILLRLVRAESFFICLHNEQEGCLEFPYCFDMEMGGVFDFRIEQKDFPKSMTASVVLSQEPGLYQTQDIQKFWDQKKVLVKGKLPHSWLGIPFTTDDGVKGAVAIQNVNEIVEFTDKDVDLLVYISHQISIALKRKNDEALLQHLALHDDLSGLANRTLFLDRLKHALKRDRRNQHFQTAIMFLDLDRFKLVNDAYGHHMGDRLIKEVSQQIQSCLRSSDTLARLGGDEFAILVEDIDHVILVEQLAQRIIQQLNQPILLDDIPILTSVSIGIAQASQYIQEASEMVKLADNAMYQAKAEGKGRYVLCCTSEKSRVVDVLTIENELANAIKNDEFKLVYQPVLDLNSEKVVGFETLIRWFHPKKGIIYPDYFIDVAEKSGQIVEIDRLVLAKACKKLESWQATSSSSVYLNVNVSSNSLATHDFLSRFQETTNAFQFSKSRLNVEITERALIDNLKQANVLLRSMKQLGHKVILDDFGTGYSSLSYLHQLPIDIVKIDRSFIMSLDEADASISIVRAIISLAQSLNMQVVAEGIEHVTQLTALQQLKAHFGQGYYFYKPLTSDDALALFYESS